MLHRKAGKLFRINRVLSKMGPGTGSSEPKITIRHTVFTMRHMAKAPHFTSSTRGVAQTYVEAHNYTGDGVCLSVKVPAPEDIEKLVCQLGDERNRGREDRSWKWGVEAPGAVGHEQQADRPYAALSAAGHAGKHAPARSCWPGVWRVTDLAGTLAVRFFEVS